MRAENEFKQLIKQNELEKIFRAEFIIKAIKIESLITDLITQHFIGFTNRNKATEFHFCLFSDTNILSFSNKREILRRIILVNNYLPDKELSKLAKSLEDIGTLRNKMAHRESNPIMLWEQEEAESSSFYEYVFKDKKIVKNIITISKQYFEKETNKYEETFNILVKLYDKMGKTIEEINQSENTPKNVRPIIPRSLVKRKI